MSAVRTAGAAFCPRCGEGRPPGAHFCPRCGLDLVGIELPEGTAPPVSPSVEPRPAPPVEPPAAPPAAPPVALPVPLTYASAVPAAAAAPFTGPVAGAVAGPSAVGRRASGAGWIVVVVATLAFLGASLALIVAGGGLDARGPLATWDRMLSDPVAVTEGEPFDLEVEAVNGASRTTDLVWLVIDWRPDDRAFDPDAVGRFVACVPADCRFRDDVAEGRTVVHWPGLAPGERQAFAVTVELTGVDGGTTLHYRAMTGTGADEASLAGGNRWSLDLDVREP